MLQLDCLGVGGGGGVADALRAELPELAVAARLRAVVAEHRAEVVEAHRLRAARHAVLQVGAADGRGALGTQREPAAAAVLEDVHLLRDDVALVARGAREDAHVLDDRRGDQGVAEQPRDALRGGADEAPQRLVLRQEVAHAARRL